MKREAFLEAAAHGGRSLRDRRRPRRPAPGAGHGRRHDARVPDVDVRAEGARRAHRLRVFAHAEPDALRAGGEPGRARGRRLGPGLQRRASRHRRRCWRCSTPASTSSRATISTADRTGCSRRCSGASASASTTPTPATRAPSRAPSGRARASAGSRRRPIRCCASPTSAPSRAICAARGVLLCVDNTFMTPYFQRPLDLGADLVVHSTTKYLNGHSDVVGGAVIGRDPELRARLAFLQNSMGGSQPALRQLSRHARDQDARRAHGAARGQRAARSRAGSSHGREIASVLYPGLPSHPQHALARRQMSGFGGMVSFAFRPGRGVLARAGEFLRGAAGVHLRGVAGRRRIAGRAPRDHDRTHRSRRSAAGRSASTTAWCACPSASSTSTT